MPHNPFLIKANLCAYVLSRFCVCNDIPLESKEVPIRREKNGVLSYMDLQKDEECHLFRSYFIFDVATKRIPLKGCFYVPDVLLPGNLHLQKHSCTTIPLGLLLAIMQQTIFSVRKVEKTWTNCVFIGPICAKSMLACYGLEWNEQFGERGSNHSFLVPAFYQRLLFGAFIR